MELSGWVRRLRQMIGVVVQLNKWGQYRSILQWRDGVMQAAVLVSKQAAAREMACKQFRIIFAKYECLTITKLVLYWRSTRCRHPRG